MYLEHFIRARDFLSQHGLKPRVVMGEPVSESDLKAVDAEIGVPIPSELRQFFLELGDAFMFGTDESKKHPCFGWRPIHLEDFVIGNKNFREDIEEAALPRINSPSKSVDSVVLRQEMERRFSWMPFWGFGAGGPYLCLDLQTKPPIVRAYTDRFWVTSPQTWNFVLAESFTNFVEKWSHYYFLAPKGDWLNHCSFLEGTFDWSPEHFPRIDVSK